MIPAVFEIKKPNIILIVRLEALHGTKMKSEFQKIFFSYALEKKFLFRTFFEVYLAGKIN